MTAELLSREIIAEDAKSSMPLRMRRRQLASASIGNVFEIYDFVIYAYLAGTIAAKFFPSSDDVASLLASFAAFGAGFLARPLGGIIIGRIGDVSGRKFALLLTIFGMALGTVGIGILPSYERVGVLAPILLVVMRLLQGFAAGGEWGGATAFIAESAPRSRRGFYGAVGQASVAAALVLASVVVALVTLLVPTGDMQTWGWRIPFLLGGLLIPVGFALRRNMEETPHFVEAKSGKKLPPKDIDSPLSTVSKAFGFTIVWTVSYYVMLSYMPTFLQKHAGLTQGQALWVNTVATTAVVILTPLFGLLSDKIGRKPILLSSCAAMVVLPYFLFSLILSHPSLPTIAIALIVGNVFIAAFSGAGPAALAELFPTHSRTTLMSTSYSLATAIFGGFAPFLSTWLISVTGSSVSPTYYVIVAGIVSGITIWTFRETAHEELR